MSRPELPYSACWTLADHVDRAASLWPDNQALVFEGVSRTFEQFADATFEFARALAALGVGHGDTVGIRLPIGIAALTALYGAARLGAIGVPLDPALRSAPLRDIARHADLKVLIVDDGELRVPDAPMLEHVVRPGTDLRALAAGVPGREVRSRQRAMAVNDTALIIYPPAGAAEALRGCRLRHEGLVRSARAFGELRFPMEPEDRLFNPLPLAGLGALQPFNACLAVGAAFVGMKRFEPAEAARVLVEQRCTVAVPGDDTVWASILERPEALDASELWLVAVDGDPQALKALAVRTPEATHVTAYGSAEVGGLIALSHLGDPLELRIGSPGRPFHGIQVKILDLETGAELPAGRTGRIAIRGWSLFQGYHKDSAQLDAAGFLHTEDVGSLDASGRLFLGDVAFVS
jgi:fatty-acyl-CoA synthase